MMDPCLSTCILCRILLNTVFSSLDIWLCLVCLWKEGFLHYLKLYPGLGVDKTACFIWAVFHKMVEVLVLFLSFPPPVLGSLLCRDSYCAAISNHNSFVRKTTAASGQSSERISVVYGTTDTNKAMLPFKLWGRAMEWWMTSCWCVLCCNR